MSNLHTENKKGRFIVLEGIDGAGKTTQAALLQAHLEAKGSEVFRTAEPTPFPSGIALREALGGKVKKSECEMATMFVLDRIAHNIHPTEGVCAKLDAGIDVLCDRYYYSTLAYQGQSTDYAWVKAMNLSCPEIRKPDLCIYLDLTPKQSLERIRTGRDSVEIYENEETLTKVRNAFLSVLDDLSETDRIVRIDAYRTPEEIAKDIADAVDALN
ncbi:MAG: dTMP kinase [Clostridia bacterium]|nr:dTMP kinase [Clostridia bacterium]